VALLIGACNKLARQELSKVGAPSHQVPVSHEGAGAALHAGWPKTLARVSDHHLRPRPRRIGALAARSGARQDAAAAGGPPGPRTFLHAACGRPRARRAARAFYSASIMASLRVNHVSPCHCPLQTAYKIASYTT